jgi:predicted nucleotidyltransferase
VSSPPIDIRPEHWLIVDAILQRHVPAHEVWAFGSRAQGRARAYSDLDLVVLGKRPLAISLLAALADDFSESDLPWKVDVVDWATTPEHFRRVIEQGHCVVRRQGD